MGPVTYRYMYKLFFFQYAGLIESYVYTNYPCSMQNQVYSVFVMFYD